MAHPYAWLDKSLNAIHRADWYRSVQTLSGLPGPIVCLEGQQVVNFASNDYLGLAGDPRLIQAAIGATQEFGTGSTGSRLLSGHRSLHCQLEEAIAALKQTEDALVFSSGYLANLGTIAALVGQRDLILSDQYNHSSLKNGALMSQAAIVEYAHCEVADLKAKLIQHRALHRRCLIVTDSVFSMDGDLCPLPDLVALAEEFECMVLVDEAHATGVMGTNGAGCVEYFGCTHTPLIQVGTLSKALGSLGGYVAGSAALIDFLRNRSPGWIYTTGLSPADTAAALAAVRIIGQEPERRERLRQHVQFLTQGLQDRVQSRGQSPFNLRPSHSPILCLQVADAATVVKLGRHLRQKGFFVAAVRPPTVPTSRIRITLMTTHKRQSLESLVNTLQDLSNL
ncbi:MAG: 8-amino-7-oxononanoate synthase [Leptolyngbyaceae cyanobacterium bins.59]|nr:8-amino-7-oxononanoate synthase [Leptolyngbyaceae cyanobacterium bins.59]